ncbi:MAG: membrane protein required for colicin V production [Oleiphilaceae bacterium]|jgi:membrane protein required for colicin V production
MSGLNWADWSFIAIISLSSLMSLRRGFIKEALSLATWVVAFIVARTFHPNLQTLLAGSIDEPTLRTIAAFSILFIGTLLVGAGVNFIVGALVRLTGLTPIDRLLGVAFGLSRGLVLSVVVIAVVRLTPFAQSEWWLNSVVIENLSILEQWSRSVFENQTKTKV